MNRIEARIVDASTGEVEHGSRRFRLDAARGRPIGQRVLILIRPETLEVRAAGNGDGDPNTVRGEIITHTFLGPVTRVKFSSDGTMFTADMPPARAAALPVGSNVSAQVPAEGPQLLTLADDAPAAVGLDPDNP
jgi:putative spermidine/putrescine transport system ATP-binding protein